MKKIVVFTDLDGTLLDTRAYTFDDAIPALQVLREKGIPLILCSSKTKTEIEQYRERLGNDHPFISENGGGIFIPEGYFNLNSIDFPYDVQRRNGYSKIGLGAGYEDLRAVIVQLRREGFDVEGFGDMTDERVAEVTGLSLKEASMAKIRDSDEPFLFHGDEKNLPSLLHSIINKGYKYTQGHFLHVLGDNDKGKAMSILIDLYREKIGELVSIAVGDSPNDTPMLGMADFPILVRKPDGSYDSRMDTGNIIRAEGIGPHGWNKAVLKVLSMIEKEGRECS
jgi:mannosyl-3-phosphoglycerate phosphatase